MLILSYFWSLRMLILSYFWSLRMLILSYFWSLRMLIMSIKGGGGLETAQDDRAVMG